VASPINAASILGDLRTHLADVLYVEIGDIEDDATFKELGLDSVLGVELISVLNGKYGLQEKIEAVHDHPTARRLADHLHSRLAGGAGTAA